MISAPKTETSKKSLALGYLWVSVLFSFNFLLLSPPFFNWIMFFIFLIFVPCLSGSILYSSLSSSWILYPIPHSAILASKHHFCFLWRAAFKSYKDSYNLHFSPYSFTHNYFFFINFFLVILLLLLHPVRGA